MLLLPVVVAAGLAVGRLGLHGHVSGMRVAADLALSWALVAAALAVRERPRWRRAGWLLATASFAVLGADLVWAASNALWTLGFLLEGLWAALLVHLVLAFPDGRPWSRLAQIAISGAYVATLGGQLVGAFVDPNTRDVLGFAPHETVAHAVDRTQEITAIVVGLVVLVLVVRRLRVLGGPARRAQGPLLVAAAVTASSAVFCLGWVIATDSASSGPRDDRPSGRRLDAVGHRRGDRVVAPAEARAVRARRRTADGGGRHARASRAGARRSDARGCVPARRRPLRRRDRTTGLTARRNGPDGNRGDRRRRGDRRARSRSGLARRAGPGGVGQGHRRARARERAAGGRGACSARRGARVARPDRHRCRRRAAPDRTRPPRRSAAAPRDPFRRARPRSGSRRPGRSGCSSRAHRTTSRPRSSSSASWHGESTRRCSGTRVSKQPSRRSHDEHRCR